MRLQVPLPTRLGWGLLLVVLVLCIIGLFTIQVSTSGGRGGGLTRETVSQLAFLGLGLIGMTFVQAIGYHRLGRWAYLLFFVCIVLLMVLLFAKAIGGIPGLIESQRSAYRWISFRQRVSIQPSELMKIAYVLGLAWYLRYRRNYRRFGGLIPPFILTLVPMGLILTQPDLGTVLLFLPVLFAMLFAAGAKGTHLGIIILMGVLSLPFFWFRIHDYQRLRLAGVALQSERVRDYLKENPRAWQRLGSGDKVPSDWQTELIAWKGRTGYQLLQSKAAVGTGGLVGQGWGQGIFVEFAFLDEKHNDFIFAMIAHQWGLVGALLTIACYAAIVLIGFDIATLTQDPFGRLVAVGFSAFIAVQTLTNLSMTIGLGPITGMTLPFVSAGGSSLVSSFLMVGFLISVHQRRPALIAKRPFEFDAEAERYGHVTR